MIVARDYDSDAEFNFRHSVAVDLRGASRCSNASSLQELVEFDDQRFHMALSFLGVNRTVDLDFEQREFGFDARNLDHLAQFLVHFGRLIPNFDRALGPRPVVRTRYYYKAEG